MPKVTIEVEVWCDCGEGLCHQSSGSEGSVYVEPCEKCLRTARDEGYEDGFDEGDQAGYERGLEEAREEQA